MSASERLKKSLSNAEKFSDNIAEIEAADLSLALKAIEAAQQLDREYENPAPDYTLRHALRNRLKTALDALINPTIPQGDV